MLLSQSEVKPRFWARQFSDKVTMPQTVFDILFGVVAPVLCFIFDPIVFKDSFDLAPFDRGLSPFAIFVYLFSALSVITLALWLILAGRRSSLNAIIAGVLLAGSACSLVIGILIFPLSILGLLFFFIGIFGFIPFVTAFVYLRNGIRAVRTATRLAGQPELTAMVLLGAVLAITPSVLAQWQINRTVTQSMNELLTGDVHAAQSATQKLRYFGWATDFDPVVHAYSRETDQTRKDTLAKSYREITGNDIENRLAILMD